MSKKTEVQAEETVEPSTALVSWEDRLAAYAVEAAAEESVVGGKFLSLKAGRLAIDKVPCAGNKLDVIVVAHTTEYALYEGKFDPNNPQPPVCYAFGKDEQQMVPHEKASKPQHADCATCPKNQWGSDPEGGKGKACKNTRRLALLPADCVNNPDSITDAEEIYLKLPVMSVKNWALYVNNVSAQYRRPPFGVVTSITTEPDAKSQFKVVFKAVSRVGDAAIGAIVQRHENSAKSIGFAYPSARVEAAGPESEKF
jgi:hypothetical protein